LSFADGRRLVFVGSEPASTISTANFRCRSISASAAARSSSEISGSGSELFVDE